MQNKLCIKNVKSLKAAGTFPFRSTITRALATKASMTYIFDIDIWV